MSRFDKLDRADDFLFKVGRWIGNRATTVGFAAWNTSPEHAAQRQRAASMMDRAVRHVGAEVRRLHEREGISARVSVAHLHEHNRARRIMSRAAR
jgi:hypothetical protein